MAYSSVAQLQKGRASWHVPLAATDAPGPWQVRATDIPTGAIDTAAIAVTP